jgi:uncharacterized protein (TIGR03086 family)
LDVVELDAAAVRTSVEVAARLTPDDVGRPTPCAGWTVADLLAHMIAQHHGFAAAAAGNGADPQVWVVRPLEGDPASAYAAAAAAVLAAFAESDVVTRRFRLPEISPTAEFPAAQAISFHFVDYVVHSWDLARSLGRPVDFAPDVLEAAYEVATKVPTGEARLAPGAAFGPEIATPDRAGQLDRIVALLGRSPTWPEPAPR